MIYDSSLVDISIVNKIVSIIRTSAANKVPGSLKRLDVRKLVGYMSLDTCERILNEAFQPKWIPYPKFNALTANMLEKLSGCDRKFISYSLQCVPEGDKKLVRPCEIRDFIPIEMATRYGGPMYILNARGAIHIMVTAMNHSERCRKIFETIHNSICTDENWIIPYPSKPAEEAITEEAVKKITKIIAEPVKDSDSIPVQPAAKKIDLEKHPKPAAKKIDLKKHTQYSAPNPTKPMAHIPLEEVFLGFINSLKPGTEIRIVVPA